MFDVIIFDLVVPAIIEVMDFAGYLSAVFKIECFVNLREATFTENGQNQISIVEHSKSLAPVDTTIFGLLFIPNPLVLNLICNFLLIEHVKLLLDSLFFILKEFLLELIDLSLFILVNVVKFTFLKVKFAIFINEWETTTLLL